MADINWPIATSVGQLYVSDNGNVWKWTGVYWEAIGTGNSLLAGVGSNSQVAIWANATTVIGSPRITYTDTAGTNVRVEINDSGIGSFLGRGFLGASANNSVANLFLSSGSSTALNSPLIQLTRYKNTIDIPQPVTTGDYLGQIQFRGTKNNAGIIDVGSSIIVEATETWSELSNLKGTKFTIKTVPNGGSLIEKFSIGGDGLIKFYETYTFPFANGINGQVLTTDGLGTLSWSTISGTVGGTGTENYVSKWTVGGTSLTNSQIQDNGSNVGIGSIDSVTKLVVETNSLNSAFRATSSKTSGAGTVAGIFQSIGNGSGPNKGLYVTSANNTNYNVGIHVEASTTSPYALWLQDGTQGSGKFLKSVTSDGKANWASITTADVSGAVGGTGVNGRIAIWNGTSTVTSDPLYKYSTVSGDGTIEIDGSVNTVKLGSYSSGIRSTSYAQFLLESFNNSNQYPWIGLTYQRGTTASGTPPLTGNTLGELRFLGSSVGAKIYAIASQNHVTGASAGTDLIISTASNSALTPQERLRVSNNGTIRFNQAYSFPVSAGTVDQTLRVDGSGNLYWAPMLSGSGTTNYLTKWSNTSGGLMNSQIRDNGSNIGIGDDPFSPAKVYINGAGFTNALFSVAGTNGNFGVRGSSQTDGLNTNTGIMGEAYNQQGPSIGVQGFASASNLTGATVIGGSFTATGSTSGSNYALQLVDGTQGAGKFLKSISSNGHANWASISASDIVGMIGGAGSTNKMAFWSSGTNLTYDNSISRYTFSNPYRVITENGISVANAYSKTSIEGSSITIAPLAGATQENGDKFIFTLGSTGTTSPYFIFESSEKLRAEDSTVGGILWNMKNSTTGINQELTSIKTKTSNDWDGNFTGDKGSSFVISTAAKGQNISEKFEIDEGQAPIAGVSPSYQSSIRIKNDGNLIIGVGTEASSKLQANLTYGFHRYGLEMYNKGLFISTYQGQLNSSNFDIYGARILANSLPAVGFENIGLSTLVSVSQGLNTGIKSEISVSGLGATSIAGWFISPSSNTNSYALRIEDGNQASGKFLKSINSDGYAEWSSITSSDVQGSIGGSGTTYRLPVWSGASGATGQTSLINSKFYDNGTVAGFNIQNPSIYDGLGPIFAMESTDPTTYTPYFFNRVVGATGTSMQVSNADFYTIITGTAPADSTSHGIRSYAAGAKKYNVGFVGSAIASSEYPLTSNVPVNSNIAVFATIQSSSDSQTNPNYYGVVSEIYSANTTNSVIGILSAVTNTAVGGSKYAIQLKDGTQGTGKFLKSITTDGKANWANISFSDVSGAQATLVSGTNIKTINGQTILGSGNITTAGGSGTTDYLPVWTNGPSGILGTSPIQYLSSTNTLGFFTTAASNVGITIEVDNPSQKQAINVKLKNQNGRSVSSLALAVGPYDNTGLYGYASGSTAKNIGVNGYAEEAIGATSIGGHFWAPNGATAYAVQIQDSSSTIPGKFLKNMTSEGHARWQSISVSDVSDAQATLVSGTNIKSINSQTLLGSGNLTVQETLVSGTNIKTVNGQTLLGSGNITISGGGVSGSGTTNYLTKWTPNGTTIGASQIHEDPTNGHIGIGDVAGYWPKVWIYSTTDLEGLHVQTRRITDGSTAITGSANGLNATQRNMGVVGDSSSSLTENFGIVGYANSLTQASLQVAGKFEAANGAFQNPAPSGAMAIGVWSHASNSNGGTAYFARFTKNILIDTNYQNRVILSDNDRGYADWGKVTSSYTQGASGTFTSADGKTITVTNGLITSIV
jgi:hypothetical protein